jgi:hypothetical protein
VLETSLRERILAGFEVESAWRTEHLGASEPSVSTENGVRGDIELRADDTDEPLFKGFVTACLGHGS